MLSAGGSRRPLPRHTAPAFRPRSRETPSRATLAAAAPAETPPHELCWYGKGDLCLCLCGAGGQVGLTPLGVLLLGRHLPLAQAPPIPHCPRPLAVSDFSIAGQFYSSKDRARLVEQPRRARRQPPPRRLPAAAPRQLFSLRLRGERERDAASAVAWERRARQQQSAQLPGERLTGLVAAGVGSHHAVVAECALGVASDHAHHVHCRAARELLLATTTTPPARQSAPHTVCCHLVVAHFADMHTGTPGS